MDNERHPLGTDAPDHALQPAVVVAVPVRHHDRPQIGEANLKYVHVVDRGLAAKPCVVDERRTAAVSLDGQQQREAVLGDQLLVLTLQHVVGHLRPLRNLAAWQEGIAEIVQLAGYVGGVNWLS